MHSRLILLQVLELLPPDWPIVSVKAFLMHSMRSSIDTSRTVKVERNLSKGENLQVNYSLVPTVQFLIACSMQKWRGKAWFILASVSS